MRKLIALILLVFSSAVAFAQFTLDIPFQQNNVVGQAWNGTNYNYTSEYFYVINNNATSDYTISIVSDDNPSNWTLTWCHELNGIGGCHPPNIAWTLMNFELGDTLHVDFTVMVNSANYVDFRFKFESESLAEPYYIPFHFRTEDYVNAGDDIVSEAKSLLKHNYPNPFNPVTSIVYFLQVEDNNAVIEILNMKGQIVKTFGNLQKGENEIVWNGEDYSGKLVSSGVYFYRLSGTDVKSDVKKMILMK